MFPAPVSVSLRNNACAFTGNNRYICKPLQTFAIMDISKFTPQFKDEILTKICENIPPYTLPTSFSPSLLCDDFDLLRTCLNKFQERGLITDLNLRRTSCTFSPTASAIELLNRGGFVFEEDILTKELEKAILEIDKLKAKPGLKKYVEQITGVTSIISNLISAIGAVRG